MFKKYILIANRDIDYFVQHCNHALNDGWIPPCGISTHVLNGRVEYCQAFIKN